VARVAFMGTAFCGCVAFVAGADFDAGVFFTGTEVREGRVAVLAAVFDAAWAGVFLAGVFRAADFVAGAAFLAGVFLAGVFWAAVFLAVVFWAAVFAAGAAFLAVVFLVGAVFLAVALDAFVAGDELADDLLAGAFVADPLLVADELAPAAARLVPGLAPAVVLGVDAAAALVDFRAPLVRVTPEVTRLAAAAVFPAIVRAVTRAMTLAPLSSGTRCWIHRKRVATATRVRRGYAVAPALTTSRAARPRPRRPLPTSLTTLTDHELWTVTTGHTSC
jgi:hypothetical protein